MPGGSSGEFGALEQHNVAPALQGQMVQRADADYAAADYDDAGMSLHGSWVSRQKCVPQCKQHRTIRRLAKFDTVATRVERDAILLACDAFEEYCYTQGVSR
jgi:hypothetical protein